MLGFPHHQLRLIAVVQLGFLEKVTCNNYSHGIGKTTIDSVVIIDIEFERCGTAFMAGPERGSLLCRMVGREHVDQLCDR